MTVDESRTWDGVGARRGRRRATALLVGCAGLTAAGTLAAPAAVAEPECLSPSYDLDGDRAPDVVVGAPGTAGREGAVEVRLTGEGDPRTVVLTGPPGFGAAVTQLTSYENEGDDAVCTQLVVGSPEETVSGRARAGAVYLYVYDGAAGTFDLRARYTADSTGVPGASQAGARFGAALTSEAFPAEVIDPTPEPLRVGSPGQDVGGVRDAGQVTSFAVGAGSTTPRDGAVLTLATAGVPGSPSTGGRLGASLSERGAVLAVGAPGQRSGGADGAGAVLLQFSAALGTLHPPQLLSQAGTGVPGTAEPGDRFGASVHLAPTGEAAAPVDLAVGSPGEDLGGAVDAGAVTVGRVDVSAPQPVGASRAWDQDSAGMAGAVERGDAFGSALSSASIDGRWRVVVGVPGEDVVGHADAGMVQAVATTLGWSQRTPGMPGTPEAGDRTGASLGAQTWARADGLPAVGVPGEDAGRGRVLSGLPVGGATVTAWDGAVAGAAYGTSVAP